MAIVFSILTSLVGAAVASALASGLFYWRPRWHLHMAWVGVLCGYWAVWPVLFGLPYAAFPPLDATHWFYWWILPVGLVCALQATQRLFSWRLHLTRLLLLMVYAGLILLPLFEQSEQRSSALLLAGLWCLGGIWCLNRADDGPQLPAGNMAVLLLLLCLASATAFLWGSSASLHQQVLILVAASVPTMVWNRRIRETATVAVWPVYLSALLWGLWLQALAYSSLVPASVALWGVLFLPQLLKWKALQQRTRVQQGVFLLIAALIYLAGVLCVISVLQPHIEFYG